MPTLARLAVPLLLGIVALSASGGVGRLDEVREVGGSTDLIDLGFAPSSTLDIDSSGRIVGVRSDADGFRVVLWQDGLAVPIHADPLASAWRPRLSVSGAITLTGTLPGESLEQALLLHSSEIIPLAPPGSRALAPMGAGAVGTITLSRSTIAAVFSPDHSPTPIPLTDHSITESAAIDANNSGDILITSRNSVGETSAWIVDHEGIAAEIAAGIEPDAINDQRDIVARRVDTNSPVLITPSPTILDLPTLPGSFGSTPNDISNTGIIVGDALVFDDFFLPTTRAWAWSDATGLLDLTTLAPEGWTLLTADALNDHGQIVGRAEHHGVITGYRLTLVPAPATLALAPLTITLRRRR